MSDNKNARGLECGPPVLLPLSRETCVGYVIMWWGAKEGGEGGLGECGEGASEEAPESGEESGYVGRQPGGGEGGNEGMSGMEGVHLWGQTQGVQKVVVSC